MALPRMPAPAENPRLEPAVSLSGEADPPASGNGWRLMETLAMRYHDGQPIHVGDEVTIDVRHEGTVVACIEDGIFLHPHTKEQWTHLHDGVLIDTSFGGVVHYADEAALEADHVRRAEKQP